MKRAMEKHRATFSQGLTLEINIMDKMNILLLNICHVCYDACKSQEFLALYYKRTDIITPLLFNMCLDFL